MIGQQKDRVKRILAWGLVMIWIMVIFKFSSDPGPVSKEKSQRLVEKVEEVVLVLEKRTETLWIDSISKDNLHGLIRKQAHVLSYFMFTLLVMAALRATRIRGKKEYLWAWCIGTLVAMGDEFYQTFIPGRSGEVRDVLIDSIGILLALLLFRLIDKVKNGFLKNIFIKLFGIIKLTNEKV